MSVTVLLACVCICLCVCVMCVSKSNPPCSSGMKEKENFDVIEFLCMHISIMLRYFDVMQVL